MLPFTTGFKVNLVDEKEYKHSTEHTYIKIFQ